MNLKKTLFLAVILAAALLYVFKVEMPREEEREAAGKPFAAVLRDEVQSVAITRPDRAITLRNPAPRTTPAEGEKPPVDTTSLEKWELTEPAGARVDPTQVGTLLSTLSQLDLGTPLGKEDVDSNRAVYGLQEPALKVEVIWGTSKKELHFGTKNDFVGKRYLGIGGSEDIYLVADDVYVAADKSRSDFRDKTPIDFVDGNLKKVTLTHGGELLVFATDDGVSWRLESPVPAPADGNILTGLFRDLRGLQTAEFVDAPEQKVYDFSKPDAVLKLELKEGDPIEYRFLRKDEKAVLQTTDRPSVHILATNPLEKLQKDSAAFRERKLARFPVDSAVKVVGSRDGKVEVTLEKVGGKWMMNGKEADQAFAEGYVFNISDTEVATFLESTSPEIFAKPYLKLDVTLKNATGEGTETRTVLVGPTEGKGPDGRPLRFATLTDLNRGFLVNDITVKRLEPKPESLLPVATPTAAAAQGPAAEKESQGTLIAPGE